MNSPVFVHYPDFKFSKLETLYALLDRNACYRNLLENLVTPIWVPGHNCIEGNQQGEIIARAEENRSFPDLESFEEISKSHKKGELACPSFFLYE